MGYADGVELEKICPQWIRGAGLCWWHYSVSQGRNGCDRCLGPKADLECSSTVFPSCSLAWGWGWQGIPITEPQCSLKMPYGVQCCQKRSHCARARWGLPGSWRISFSMEHFPEWFVPPSHGFSSWCLQWGAQQHSAHVGGDFQAELPSALCFHVIAPSLAMPHNRQEHWCKSSTGYYSPLPTLVLSPDDH